MAGTADGKPFAIVGSLDYAPAARRTLWPFVVAGAAIVILLSSAAVVLAAGRRRR